MMLQTGRGGSVPEIVMRTGVVLPFSPLNARHDVSVQHVINETTVPTGMALPEAAKSEPLPPAPQNMTTAQVAVTTKVTPPMPIATAVQSPAALFPAHRHFGSSMSGGYLGEWQGRPVASFQIAASPPAHGAHAAAAALKHAARVLQRAGAGSLPPELIAGPLAALMRGGAVELHFANGVVVRTAL